MTRYVANSAPAGRLGGQPADDPGAAADDPGAGSDNPGTAGDNPGAVGEDRGAADLVTAAVAELYDADPQEFTDRRKALAAAARAADDAAAAKQIAALRKPTRAAWVVNRLARTDPGAPTRLASLAAALQAAQRAKDGPRLRELSAARGPLIDALAGQALDAAGVPDPPAGLREEVTETLTAALADPDVAARFASGTLTRAVQWAGFGVTPFGGTADDSGPADALAADESLPAEPRLRAVSPPGEPPLPPARPRRDTSRRSPGPETADSAPADEEALAAEAEKRAAQRREIIADAERELASAEAAAKDAVAAEDRLEAEVRDLEQRLTQARTDLANARLRARRAEAAERRALQALARLPRPLPTPAPDTQ
jgi:hypothetical protein